MMTNLLTGLGAIVILGGVFYGGMWFQKWRTARKAVTPATPPTPTK
jgi:hypothetical protein